MLQLFHSVFDIKKMELLLISSIQKALSGNCWLGDRLKRHSHSFKIGGGKKTMNLISLPKIEVGFRYAIVAAHMSLSLATVFR